MKGPVDFYPQTFQEIPHQDNPAFGEDECLMIVRTADGLERALVLHIKPDPVEAVNHIAVFWRHDIAWAFCRSYPTLETD